MIITVPEGLWASTALPEGVFERWVVADGTMVETGDWIAEITVEDARHDLMAPIGGRLRTFVHANAIIELGTVLGRVVSIA